MGSLFASLDIGRKSLQAHQLALQVTSNNMANINTPGYSRQQAVFETDFSVQTAAGLIGSGVTVKNIVSARDRFIELRVADQTQHASEQEALFNTLDQIQRILPSGTGGLQDGISRFFNSFSTLANNPESSALRNAVLSAAQNLATAFNGTARQLEETKSSVNRSIEDAVNKVNVLAGNVATLNQEIIVAEGGGTEASGLRDQRQEYIKELSSLVDVHYYEAQDGAFYVSVAGGHSLVSGNTTQPLSAVPVGIQGNFEVHSGVNNITNLISGGEVAGFIELRDRKIPAYLDDLDTLANTIISQVNAQHGLGTDLLGNAGVNFFNPTPAPSAPLVLPAGAAGNFSVNASLVADPRLVAAGQSGEAGDNANALALAGLAAAKTLNGGVETFAEGFASLQFRVGTDTQGAKRTFDAQSAVLTQLQNQRDSVSGVSLDEEALDLVRFQRAYQAATKFISTIDQLTGDIIAAIGR